MIYKWLKSNLSRHTTHQCSLCLGATDNKHLICVACESDLPKNGHHCVICSIPFASSHLVNQTLVCGKCQKQPPNYTTSCIPLIYASPIKQLITNLKFKGNLAYAPLLANTVIEAVTQRQHRLPDCIIPVPLHKQRLHERGFNQALELARIISKPLNIPIDYTVCTRNKSTPEVL